MEIQHIVLAVLCWVVVLGIGCLLEFTPYFQRQTERGIFTVLLSISMVASIGGTLLMLTSLRSTVVAIGCMLILFGLAYVNARVRKVLRTLAAYCLGGMFIGIILRIILA